MNTIPDEWIDKLFSCMKDFYGNRWFDQFKRKNDESFYKTIWKNGLIGLSYDDIKNALRKYKVSSNNGDNLVPYVTDFYQVAKNEKIIYEKRNLNSLTQYSHEVRNKAMSEIREKLSQ